MKTSQRAIELIKKFEGCSLTTYLDSVKVPTIGYGHTGPDVKMGLRITQQEADDLLIGDLIHAEDDIARLVKVPLTENEHGALVSFVFNLGGSNLAKSTLLKLLNQMRYADAAEEFLRWDFAGGVRLAGLTRRRQAERDLFKNG